MKMLRRDFVLSLLSGLSTFTGSARSQTIDQGIGGTGLAAAPPTDSDRGIGGTGVIGTIRRFGSIVVNDLRIGFPNDVAVFVDARAASLDAVRVGHVVAVVASGPSGQLKTGAINIEHEVVGPIDAVSGRTITVLGQTVLTTKGVAALQSGTWVAVSGIRRTDGVIAASLIEPTTTRVARVAGPQALLASTEALAAAPFPQSQSGGTDRILVEGTYREGHLEATSVGTDPGRRLLSEVRTLSIEAFASKAGGSLRLGSGFEIADAGRVQQKAGRVIVSASVGASDALRLRSTRSAAEPQHSDRPQSFEQQRPRTQMPDMREQGDKRAPTAPRSSGELPVPNRANEGARGTSGAQPFSLGGSPAGGQPHGFRSGGPGTGSNPSFGPSGMPSVGTGGGFPGGGGGATGGFMPPGGPRR